MAPVQAAIITMAGQRNYERATHVRDLRHMAQRRGLATLFDNAARGKVEELAGTLLALSPDDSDRTAMLPWDSLETGLKGTGPSLKVTS